MPSDHENDYKSWAREFYDFARSSYSQNELFMIQCEIVGIASFLEFWRSFLKSKCKNEYQAHINGQHPNISYFLYKFNQRRK